MICSRGRGDSGEALAGVECNGWAMPSPSSCQSLSSHSTHGRRGAGEPRRNEQIESTAKPVLARVVMLTRRGAVQIGSLPFTIT